MKSGYGVKYRLSPNEEARLIKDEREKRRKARLLQVREQAKLNAAKIRQAVKDEKNKQLQKLAQDIKDQWVGENEERARKLEELYIKSMKSVGESHIVAAQYDPKDDMRALLAEEDKRRAAVRHRNAVLKQRQDDELKRAEENKHIFARQAALEVEKMRAADVASRPPPPPDPINSIEPVKVKPVQFTDLNAFSATHFHIPSDCAVAKATESEQIDAKASAEEEEQKIRDLDLEKKRLEIERKEKARLRHLHAREREVLKLDYDKMMHDLSDLQRADRTRRQNIIHKMPKQIFQPPHRRLEEKEDEQMNMERAFEDMYMAATDFIGDLSLALDPQPAPETPTATESLELSTLDDDGQDNRTSPEERPPAVRLDASRTLPPLKAHLNAKDKSSDTTLKKLFDKIKSQREEWISKSSIEGSSEADVTDTTSSASGQVKTLTQYTITSGESESQTEGGSISTGEVSSKTGTSATRDTSDRGSQQGGGRVNGDVLEEGSITSSGTLIEEENTLLHPVEIANKVRQKSQEGDISAFLAEERMKQEQIRQQEMQIMEETFKHQKELERQKEMIEQRLREMDQQAKEAHQELILTQQQVNGPLLGPAHANSFNSQPSVPEPRPYSSSYSTQSQSRPGEAAGQGFANGTDYRPLVPGEGSTFSTSQESSIRSLEGQYSGHPSVENTSGIPAGYDVGESGSHLPFARAEEQMKSIQEYQEQLMRRHRDRQEALLEARQNLDRRARDLLDDSLQQVGLNPIYDGRSDASESVNQSSIDELQVRQGLNGEQQVSHAGQEMNQIQTDSMDRRTSTEYKSQAYIPQTDLQQQLEDIERQKQEILERDLYHREQIDKLKLQWEEQFEQTKKLGDSVRKSQAQAAMETGVLHVMEDNLHQVEQSNEDGRHRQEDNNLKPDLSTIYEQPSPDKFSRLSANESGSLPSASFGPGQYRYDLNIGENPSLSGTNGISDNGQISPDLEVQSIEAFGQRLAQIQQDFGQLTAQVNSYLEEPGEEDSTFDDGQTKPPYASTESTPNKTSKASSTQHIIDDLISPLRPPDNCAGNYSLGSDKSSGSHLSSSQTWHARLLGFGNENKGREHSHISTDSDGFFAIRPELASPSIDDPGFDVNHRLSSTPVDKGSAPREKSPQFKALQPDSTRLSGATNDISQHQVQSDSRMSDLSAEKRPQTALSEPSQYPLVNDTDVKSNKSGLSSDSRSSSKMENISAQSPSQYPLQEHSPKRGVQRPRSPTSRYSADPYFSSSSSCSTRENADDLTRRIEATLSAHELLLRESREIRERHLAQRKSPLRLSSDGQLMKEDLTNSPGISEEPDLTLVSNADSSIVNQSSGRFSPLHSSLEKTQSSLLSFEKHEQSITSDGSPQKFSPLKGYGKSPKSTELEESTDVSDFSSQDQISAKNYMEHFSNSEMSNGNKSDEGSRPGDKLSLQEAFQREKARFIEESTRRKLEAKEKARQSMQTKHTDQQGQMLKTMVSWKKQRSSQPKATKKRDPTNITSVTSTERQRREKQMKERTTRLYSQLEEVKQQKVANDRKQIYAQNREKAKEYSKKQKEKIKKK